MSDCAHQQLHLGSVELAKWPDGPVGLVMCCSACGKPIRQATRAEWHEAYKTQAIAETYPLGYYSRDGRIIRGLTPEEHAAWLAGCPSLKSTT